MDLITVFLIIATAILLIIGLLWLISWLMGSRGETDNDGDISSNAKRVTVTEPKEETETARPVEPLILARPEPDDLTVIEGIDPQIAGILNQSGITTFTQLAATIDIILESILKEANLRIANPSGWGEQAALAAEGKWDELQNLKDELQGGRKVD